MVPCLFDEETIPAGEERNYNYTGTIRLVGLGLYIILHNIV